MLLDLFPSSQEQWAKFKPNEGARLPATTEEGFAAAWNESRLFSQSGANGAAQIQAIEDYVGEVKRKTGTDLTQQASQIGIGGDFSKINDEVAKLNAGNPDLRLTPLSMEEVDRRGALLSRQARKAYEEQQQGEGGGFGRFLGGLAGAATDPLNLVAGVFGGGEAGIVLTALKFGGAAAAAQIGNEAIQADYREKVQPGYAASGEPGANILGTAAGGAAFGAGGKIVGMAVGRLWGRAKTGTWPTSVRDAGNVLESEANVQGTNVYPGVAGEAAHRDALAGAVDQIVRGEPVDVAAHITPEIEASAAPMPPSGAAFVEQKGDADFLVKSTADPGDMVSLTVRPDAVQVGMSTVGPKNRGQGVGTALYEKALEFATERGLPLRSDFSVSAPAVRVYEALRRRGYQVVENPDTMNLAGGAKSAPGGQSVYEVRPSPEMIRARAAAAGDAAQAERAAATTGPAPELPFEATAAEAQAETAMEALRSRVAQIAESGGHTLAPDEVAAIADRLAKAGPEEAADALRAVKTAPHQFAAEPARAPKAEPGAEPVAPIEPKEVAKTLAAPDHEAAVRSDIERAIAMKDVKIPAGVDERGEPIYRSATAALDEVDQMKAAADHIQACVNPVREAAE